jgi:hypothetical protein
LLYAPRYLQLLLDLLALARLLVQTLLPFILQVDLNPVFYDLAVLYPDHRWFRQEYMCEFAEPQGAVFSHGDLAAALDSGVRPLFGRS